MVLALYAVFAVLFLAGYGGALHPALDSLSVLRLPLAAVLVASLALRTVRRPVGWGVSGAAALALALHLVGWPLGVARDGSFTVYQKNISPQNGAIAAIVADIRAVDPDVITLNEVSAFNRARLVQALPDYPVQHHCYTGSWAGIVIFSRLPEAGSPPICAPEFRAFGAIEVVTQDGPGWVVAVHLHWPFPFDQPRDTAHLHAAMAELPGPKVLVGDFNAMPWSYTVRSSARAAGVRYLGPRRATWTREGVSLPIDHVLAARGWVERRAAIDSDHRALAARVGFAP
ncbi:MAG: endonuclease/exonuclease/phosphatase family protein [Pseudomonadota bacterium]